MTDSFDYVLVGGGLQSALVALVLLRRRPGIRVALVEKCQKIGGNHLWSFHADDVPAGAEDVVAPLCVARWTGFDVAFPGLRRTFDSPYASVDSERLHTVVVEAFAAAPGHHLALGVEAVSIGAHEVHLADGRVLRGEVVVDARGPDGADFTGALGFQKFVGLELALARPHGLPRPMLMDATVPQTDGLRFFYVLPLAADRVLVEDTYFSSTPVLAVDDVRACVLEYASQAGFAVAEVIREEVGCLPLPLSPTVAASSDGPLVAGYRGGFFHPTTGYSFPVALRLALHLASVPPSEARGPLFARLLDAHATQLRFAGLLNRLLFSVTPAPHRRDVMERFHRLPAATIRRFYALATTRADRLRVFLGRPPRGVSVRAALAEVLSA
ncbi:MAG: lycopene beta-cyclase CrtY [Verrucomicrobia bacterium]|nr:lycopene beta-cyclase CrtY [Verrucomicrobiota bacterium]